jgi:hypothetical protein
MVMDKRLFQWCPILVEPIPGSGEKIVLAIAVCDENRGAVVEPLASPEDLPDGWLRTSMHAIGPLLGAFETTLIEHGNSALKSEAVLSHGVCLGTVRLAFGIDAQQVARSVSKITASLLDITQVLAKPENPISHLKYDDDALGALISRPVDIANTNNPKEDQLEEDQYYSKIALS